MSIDGLVRKAHVPDVFKMGLKQFLGRIVFIVSPYFIGLGGNEAWVLDSIKQLLSELLAYLQCGIRSLAPIGQTFGVVSIH